ncbi:MAG: hypothetical protein H0U74_05340, partial [Bradymonadaceae bacterium]|nr:hypothetical protein [Lujinxingiaceae bacterium]
MDRENKVQQFVAQLEANPYDLAPMGRLERAFAGKERWEELVLLLEHRAGQVDSRDAAARLYLEAARMAGARLNDVDRSLELLTHSLAVGEDTLVSVEAYLFQLALQQDGEQLLTFFVEAVEHGEDEIYKSRLYQRMGCILEDFMGDMEEADNAYKWALQFDPANVLALWSRQLLAKKESAWARFAELLVEEIERSDDPAEQAEQSITLGEIYRDYLDSADAASQCFDYALELDPQNERARGALGIGTHDFEVNGLSLDQATQAQNHPPDQGEEDRPMTMELDEAMLYDGDAQSAAAPPPVPEVVGFQVDDEEDDDDFDGQFSVDA